MGASHAIRPGDVLAGRYRIEQILDAGAMGVVARAHQLDLCHDVAIKVMHPTLLVVDGLLERFRREAQIQARLRSRHATRVLDLGSIDDGLPFLVMELLQGVTLAERLASGTLMPGEAVQVALQICDVVGEAHDLGIVHRDIKPANVFLAEQRSGDVVAKVLDFGIAKCEDDAPARTEAGVAMGSPRYMSPEQMHSARCVDARTDVWSIGVVLYEMLTGGFPYTGATFAEIAVDVHAGPARPISELAPQIDGTLADAVMSCLERDVARRCPSVGELARRLRTSSVEPAPLRAIGRAPSRMRAADTLVVDLLRNAASARPSVVAHPSRFRCALESALSDDVEPSDLHVDDLYLAVACLDGDPGAIEVFDREVVPALSGCAGARRALLFGEDGGEPDLVRYRARTPLASWARVVARRRAPRGAAPSVGTVLFGDGIAEASTLRRLHGDGFEDAAASAWRALASRDRTVLRFMALGVPIAAIARMVGVDPAAVVETSASARATALARVRAHLCEREGLTSGELRDVEIALARELEA